MITPRRLSASLVALATTAALGPLATAPASAAPAPSPRPAVVFDDVRASAEATPDGTEVSTTFTVRNRSERRRDARTAYLSLVAVDRDPGPTWAYRLGTVRIPALAAGDARSFRSGTPAPRAVVAGDYHVRVCSTRVAGNGTCSTSRRWVTIAEADVELDQDDIVTGDVLAGTVSDPLDVVVTNTGQSRTNRVRLAVRGGDHPEDFSVEDGTCTTWLAAGESCTAHVVFAPAEDATGIRNSALLAGGRGRGGVVVASLTGTVVAPDNGLSITPASHDYGTVAQGQSASQTFVLTNDTDTDAQTGGDLSDFENFAYDFSGPFTCLEPLPAGGSCTVTVTFTPSAADSDFSATMTLFAGLGHETAFLVGNSHAPATGPAYRAPSLARSFR